MLITEVSVIGSGIIYILFVYIQSVSLASLLCH